MNEAHATLDTRRSDAVASEIKSRTHSRARRVIEYCGTLPAPAETIFAQLCPTREHDWIDGWAAELIFSRSGYAEEGCVFRTGEDNVTGPGVWVVSHHEPPRLLKIVRVMEHAVVHLVIAVADLGDGSSDLHWTVTVTALDEAGDAAIAALPPGDGLVVGTAGLLAHYLATGGMKGRVG